jgi:hypothetical protein
MAYRRSDWPLTLEQLKSVISLGETTLVEFKREWGTLDKLGQAKLARQVMALANTVRPDDLALLVFGIEDERHGGRIASVQDVPNPESLTQMLEKYMRPTANIECKHYKLSEGTVSAVAVLFAPARPHYCIRDFPGILSTSAVYVRRDKQVGILSPPELEQMIREKDGGFGPPTPLDPLEFGFVAFETTNTPSVAVRIRNLTAEPLSDITVFFDVAHVRDPSVCFRTRQLSNAALGPGESREVLLELSSADFYKTFWRGEPLHRDLVEVRDLHFVGDRWLNIAATLLFRGIDGLLHSRTASIPFGY